MAAKEKTFTLVMGSETLEFRPMDERNVELTSYVDGEIEFVVVESTRKARFIWRKSLMEGFIRA